MKKQGHEIHTDNRKIAYSKMDVIKLDTKCLYAGKLERIKQWHEKPHSHPFCEIMMVISGSAGKAWVETDSTGLLGRKVVFGEGKDIPHFI